MIKIIILNLLFLFSTCVLSIEIKYSSNKKVNHITTHTEIIKKNKINIFGKKDSMAYKHLESFSKEKLSKIIEIDLELGVYICKESFKGFVGLGINQRGNSVSFCKFDDNSLIPINELTSWTRKTFLK